MNHYTEKAITALGELIGHVDTVAFDPNKSQRYDFVRVKIILHVSKPLSKFRTINLRGRIQHTVYFYYEKAQKRYYLFQRLTHADDQCPFVNRDRQSFHPTPAVPPSTARTQHSFSENNPLFGVLKDDQVGINPISGRPRIAPEVLPEMHNYLVASNGEDIYIKGQRVISSVKAVEQDPTSQKTFLQLIPPPTIIKDLNKGKGVVFDYEPVHSSLTTSPKNQTPKLMSAAIFAGRSLPVQPQEHGISLSFTSPASSHIISSTVSQLNFSLTDTTGAPNVQGKARKRPGKYKRKAQVKSKTDKTLPEVQAPSEMLSLKRKAEDSVADAPKPKKLKASEMVPMEGPSNA